MQGSHEWPFKRTLIEMNIRLLPGNLIRNHFYSSLKRKLTTVEYRQEVRYIVRTSEHWQLRYPFNYDTNRGRHGARVRTALVLVVDKRVCSDTAY